MEPIKPRGGGGMGEFVTHKPRPTVAPSQTTQKPVRHEATPLQPASPTVKRAQKRFHKLRLWWLDAWQPLVISLSVGLIVTTVLGFHIGSLTPGVSPVEKRYVHSVTSGQQLIKHPTFMPHKLPTYLLFKAGVTRPGAYRAVSALIAVSAIISCFFILRRWYSLRVAVLGSWLLLTSAWLLHFARLATPESSFLLLMPLIWMAVWMYNTPKRRLALTVLVGVSIVSFYIPAFCWLVIGTVIWQRTAILEQVRQTEWWFRILAGLLAIVLLAPLAIAAVLSPRELLLISGLPTSLPSFSSLWQNALNVPLNMFLRGPESPATWLGRLPLLDIFNTAMLLLGVYSLRYHVLLIRAQLVIAASIILFIFVVSGGPVISLALLPVVYILIAGGMAFMLTQWFTVFPRNPIARGLGTTILSVLVLLVSFYHINHYFIAWPHAPATSSAFGQILLK